MTLRTITRKISLGKGGSSLRKQASRTGSVKMRKGNNWSEYRKEGYRGRNERTAIRPAGKEGYPSNRYPIHELLASGRLQKKSLKLYQIKTGVIEMHGKHDRYARQQETPAGSNLKQNQTSSCEYMRAKCDPCYTMRTPTSISIQSTTADSSLNLLIYYALFAYPSSWCRS
jgi:hypothetical protein